MNVIDRDLEAVKRIADALTPLGIDVVAVRSVTSVDLERQNANPRKSRQELGSVQSRSLRFMSRSRRIKNL